MFRFVFRTLPLSFFNIVRLLLFVVCLFPGFIRFAWYYFIASDRVTVHYGAESVRQRIDIYRADNQTKFEREGLLQSEISEMAEESCSTSPVLIFCTGGAWMIGYKMWGTLLARALTAAGVVVVIPDMRNYPLVYIPDMVDDVDLAIDWTIKNIAQYGGDPTNVIVVGQSAGGHIACMAIFRKIQKKIARENAILAAQNLSPPEMERELRRISEEEKLDEVGWSASNIRGFSAISSPLTLGTVISQSFKRLGFDDTLVHRMFGFEKDNYDPLLALQNLHSDEDTERFRKELPPISIYQGTVDKTVPFEVSEIFYRELRRVTPDVSFTPYNGWSHTDPILEGPMDADHRLHKDLFDDVITWSTSPDLTWPDDPRVNDRLCPNFLVRLSRVFNPF